MKLRHNRVQAATGAWLPYRCCSKNFSRSCTPCSADMQHGSLSLHSVVSTTQLKNIRHNLANDIQRNDGRRTSVSNEAG